MIVSNATAHASVDAVLETFFAERIARAASSDATYETLWRRMRDAARGGKRVRPQLVLLTHRLLGGVADEDALSAATAIELLHTALLFHDDILDGDLIRRGRPNLQGRFVTDALGAGREPAAASTWGTTAALLGGDLLISAAHAFIARIRSDARVDVHEIFDESLFATAAGELADVGFGLGTMRAEPYAVSRMMADKTANYSFSTPLRMGAALAGADAETLAELSHIGAAAGFIYQLRDDVLGIFGDAVSLGKSTDGDLREGKRTLVIAYAETSPAWAPVSHLFGHRSMSDDDVQTLRDAITASGAVDQIEQIITQHTDQLCARIAHSNLPMGLRRELVTLAHSCGERSA